MKIALEEITETFNNLLGFEGNEIRGSVGELVMWSCTNVYGYVSREGENNVWSIAIGENSLNSREFSGSLNELEKKVQIFATLDKMRKL